MTIMSGLSHFDAKHSIQEVVCISDVFCDKTMTVQQQAVLLSTPLLPFAHAEGLEQPTSWTSSVFIQENLTYQKSAAWQQGASVLVQPFCHI